MSKLETNTIDNISGSSTLNLGDTNATNITIDNGVTTLDFGTGISTVSNIPAALKMTPSFKAHLASNQTIGTGSFTKALFATEDWDTDSAFASNKFTVPTGEGGKYLFIYNLLFYSLDASSRFEARLYKNGSGVGGTTLRVTGSQSSQQVDQSYSVVVEASAADYFEVYVFQNTGSNQTLYGPDNGDSAFTGYKLIGV